jgi:hypothetical protein
MSTPVGDQTGNALPPAGTSTEDQGTSTRSEGRTTRDTNSLGGNLRSINCLRRKHPRMSGRTVLTTGSTQVHSQDDSTPPQQPPPRSSGHTSGHRQAQAREQSNDSDTDDSDSDDSDNSLAAKLEPTLMKALQRISKNTGCFQMNDPTACRWKRRGDENLQREKDSDTPNN